MDINCQQICKISRKDLTELKIFLKVLGATFLRHPVLVLVQFINGYSHNELQKQFSEN